MYRVDSNGSIQDPGKFEGCPVEALALYELAMCSCADEEFCIDNPVWLFEPGEVDDEFLAAINEEWRDYVNERLKAHYYYMTQTTSGHIYCEQIDEKEYEQLKQDLQREAEEYFEDQ